MTTATGLDILIAENFQRLQGKSIGLLCNQASVSHDYDHILDLLIPLHRTGFLNLTAVFGPEHGLYGHTQDNMIEWEGKPDPRMGVVIHSLYGNLREPSAKMLENIDLFVVDIQDVGSRYYTFVWTMCLCMKACAERGIPVMVLDRPNPIGGTMVEGTLLDANFSSFVGLHEVLTRHGMTAAEIALFAQQRYYPKVELQSVLMSGWNRDLYLDQTDAPWSMPSPNMPTIDSAAVYPGGCLLEATNMSEGRGTTRPFEIVGAPYLDGWNFASSLNSLGLEGIKFRPLQFEPTFNKHKGKLCEGVFLHVTDRQKVEPVLVYIAIMQEAIRLSGLHDSSHVDRKSMFIATSAESEIPGFCWKQPPYEYETVLMPIDILLGNDWLKQMVENLTPIGEIRDRFRSDEARFAPVRKAALLYS